MRASRPNGPVDPGVHDPHERRRFAAFGYVLDHLSAVPCARRAETWRGDERSSGSTTPCTLALGTRFLPLLLYRILATPHAHTNISHPTQTRHVHVSAGVQECANSQLLQQCLRGHPTRQAQAQPTLAPVRGLGICTRSPGNGCACTSPRTTSRGR